MSKRVMACGIKREFTKSAASHPVPFSLRLSIEERAILDHRAGSQPLGAYIRDILFDEQIKIRRKQRRPQVDEKHASALLAALGKSRLSSNVNQLAKAANMGALDVPSDVEQQLQEAAAAILAMREALFTALGLKSS